jgi:hypothetical protein
MLTQLTTIKTRLGLSDFDVKDDALLTNFIKAFSAQADNECRRTLARMADTTQEFNPAEPHILLASYPLETVSRFELKTNETDGWVVQPNVEFLIRRNCVISLAAPLGTSRQDGRVTYTGGYVLPGTTPGAGQTALPSDLEQAAVEQVAAWYQNRDKLGLTLHRPYQGTYDRFAQVDLLPNVRIILEKYERWNW